MGDYSEAFVGLDTSKLRNAVAIADAGRGGEVRFFGEIENTPAATAKLVLTRARETAMLDLRTKRQHVSAFLLRLGRPYPESRKTWTKAHVSWIASQKLEHPQQRLVLEEMMLAIRQAQERLQRLEQAIAAAVPAWSLAPQVTALMAMRGIDLISATTLLAEIGDLSRFQTPTELMAYLGLVPSEDSTGDTVKRGPITKAGNRRARRMLVECSWS